MSLLRATPLALIAVVAACQLLPAKGLTCNGVPQDTCNEALDYVQLVFEERGGETLTSVEVGPTQVTDCLHDDEPLADVAVGMEGRAEPEVVTFARTLTGDPSICFH